MWQPAGPAENLNMMSRRKDQRQVTEGGLKEATFEMSLCHLQKARKNTQHAADGSSLKFGAQGSGVVTASEMRVRAEWGLVCS